VVGNLPVLGQLPARLWRALRRSWLGLLILADLAFLTWAVIPQALAWHEFRAGREAVERGHTPEARAHLGYCLAVWPRCREAHLLAARAARRADDFDKAQEHLNACQPGGEKPSEDAALEWAMLQAARANLDPVEESLLVRADRDPANAPLIREALVAGYLRLYRFIDARTCLEVWQEQQPNSAQLHFMFGNAWRHVNNARQAIPEYTRAVEIDPGHLDAQRWLAFCLMEIGQYEEALKHLQVVDRALPGDLDVVVRIARCRNSLGQADEARKLLDRVLRDHPDDPAALRARGQVELQAGRCADAEPWLRRAADIQPWDYLAQWFLLQALQGEGKTDEARLQQEKAHQVKDVADQVGELTSRKLPARPNDPRLRCDLGVLLVRTGHEDMGERWLLGAIAIQPDWEPAHAALAELYARRGDKEKAAYHRKLAGTEGKK
jgi:tetratricopeptide (TPR) repeat protein